MKKITFIILYLSFLVPQSAIPETVPDCKLKDQRVENYIADKTRKLQGHEYCQFRRYDSEDIDGDNIDDFIVIYSIEGVHNNMGQVFQFMLVYLSSRPEDKPLETKVGERGKSFANEILRVQQGKIYIKDQVYQKSDALCCPSGKGESVYEIKKGKLLKTKTTDG